MYRRTDRRARLRSRQGFTLIEAMVAAVLVAIALVGAMGGIRALGQADVKANDADLMQRLAAQKLSTMGVMQDANTDDQKGDFQDQGHPEITWTMDIQPSGANYVDEVTITATHGNQSEAITSLVFTRPTSGTGAGATGGTTP